MERLTTTAQAKSLDLGLLPKLKSALLHMEVVQKSSIAITVVASSTVLSDS